MGRNCLRSLIDHPAIELAGVYVYGAGKDGKDAGELARRPLTGVIATRDVEQVHALDADVVVHAARLAPPYGAHDADLERLLASGRAGGRLPSRRHESAHRSIALKWSKASIVCECQIRTTSSRRSASVQCPRASICRVRTGGWRLPHRQRGIG